MAGVYSARRPESEALSLDLVGAGD